MGFEIFTAWSPLLKSHSEQITNVANILADKSGKDITFTAIDMAGNLEEFVLGTIEGNSKFLLGYCNPGFKLCPYHFVILDPNITEDEAQKLYDERGHPANPRFWAEFDIEPFAEGDDEGTPHSSFSSEGSDSTDSSFEFSFKGQSYIADPENQLVYSQSEDKVYHWNLLRNTYFSSQNPELYGLMELHKVVKQLTLSPVEETASVNKGFDWHNEVLPLVKGVLPRPGSVIKVETDTFGIITTDSIEFTNKQGVAKSINILDNSVTDISLTTDGVGTVILLKFLEKYLHVDVKALEQYID